MTHPDDPHDGTTRHAGVPQGAPPIPPRGSPAPPPRDPGPPTPPEGTQVRGSGWRNLPWLPIVITVAVCAVVLGSVLGLVQMHNSGQATKQKNAAVIQQQQKDAAAASSAAAKASQDAAIKKAQDDASAARNQASQNANRPNTVVVPPQVVVPQPAPGYYPGPYGNYYSPAGTYSLSSEARPGPIHSYSQPNDSSSFVRTISADEQVTVYCSTVGQWLQGRSLSGSNWDWDGSGWIWDQMVSGPIPPSCSG